MKKALIIAGAALSLAACPVLAENNHEFQEHYNHVRYDHEHERRFHEIEEAHKHVQEAIEEIHRARYDRQYKMEGHGGQAEDLLRSADEALRLSLDAAERNER
jgi:hypothetical protein